MTERGPLQRVICWLYALIYRRWIWEDNAEVLRVYGWRTALIGYGPRRGMRKTITPVFWWEKLP